MTYTEIDKVLRPSFKTGIYLHILILSKFLGGRQNRYHFKYFNVLIILFNTFIYALIHAVCGGGLKQTRCSISMSTVQLRNSYHLMLKIQYSEKVSLQHSVTNNQDYF